MVADALRGEERHRNQDIKRAVTAARHKFGGLIETEPVKDKDKCKEARGVSLRRLSPERENGANRVRVFRIDWAKETVTLLTP